MRERMKKPISMSLFHTFSPEIAHKLALNYLKLGLGPKKRHRNRNTILETTVAGIRLDNPIGLSAGFDKNAEAVTPLYNLGFGFIEIGAVTPKPQDGNPKPRVFRVDGSAIINRLGFNNEGMEAVKTRLSKKKKEAIIGLNLGSNKDTKERSKDFSEVLKCCGNFVDFATINVSSPNTKALRTLQSSNKLKEVIDTVLEANSTLRRKLPIFLKISPDLNDNELLDIVNVSLKTQISGLIATNTSTGRSNVDPKWKDEPGGLSGPPIFQQSTQILAKIAVMTENKIPLIGVGGVSSAKDAYAKICAGASAIQLYSSLTIYGPRLISSLLDDLTELITANGFTNISEAVGTKKFDWV